MSAPYHFTPRIPSAPHSTPFSASSYKLPNAKSIRPPIHNPYDKFTQPEFDAWIGGITGALKRALGQEDEESNGHEKSTALTVIHSRPRNYDDGDDDSELSDGAVDDSFAEIKARRAVGKGKARDPREGPGLGKGNSLQPIEIISSDEEEDAEDAAEVELSMAIGDDSGSDNSEEDGEEQSEEEEYSWERGQSSSQPLPSPDKTARRKEAASREEYGSEEEEEEGEEYDEEGVEHEEFDEEEYDEEEEEGRTGPVQVASDEIIEIDSDSEGEVDEDELSGEEDLSSSPRKARAQSLEADGNEREEDEEVSDGYEEYDDEEEDQLGTSQLLYSRDQIRHPRDDEYEEDEGADMVDADADADDDDDDDDIQEIQPPENDTSFPPKPYTSPIDSKKHIEILDPWSGPRTYAEDYYSGGDIRIPTGERVDAHHLGSLDVEPESTFDSERGKDADIEQPLEEDTSFPPRDENVKRPVDIADPWEGPQMYAEDFYSGGPVHLSQGGHPTAHYLGPMDVDYVEELDAIATPQASDEQAQPLNEDTSFPDEIESNEIPIQIQDPWAGPQTYAEDYYSGGDVRTMPGVPIDPALLSGTGEVEDDIDSFLTPGALTPSQVADDQNEEVYDDEEEEAQGEEEEEEEEGSILPPLTNHYISSTSRRNQPIPADAEFIALDDSDDEQEANSFKAERKKEDTVDSDDLTLEYPQDHQIQQEQKERVDDWEMEEGVEEEVDELDDEDIVAPPSGPITQAETDVSVSGPPLEERGIEEVHESKEDFKLSVPSEQELSELHTKADQQTAILTEESELQTRIEANLPDEGHYLIPDENRDASLVPEARSEEMPMTEIVIEEETQTDSSVEISTEAATESHPVLVEDAATAVTDESVDDQMDSEPQQEHTSIEEISVEEVSTYNVDLLEESAETATFVNIVATEIDEVSIEGAAATASEDVVIPEDHEDSNGAATDGDEKEVPMANVSNTAESDDDDIRSTPGLEDDDALPTSALPSASGPSHTHGQLPTPPSEKSRSLPPEVEESIPAAEAPRKHKVEIEEIPDEDVSVPEPLEDADAIPGLSSRKPSESPHPVDDIASSVQGEASDLMGPDTHDDYDIFMDEDAYGEIDDENGLDYIEVRSVGSEEIVNDEAFIVEETSTEGRLTVELSGREMSLDVVSIGSEEAADDHNDGDSGVEDDHNSLPTEHVAPAPLKTAEMTASEQILEEEGLSSVAEPDQNEDSQNIAETVSGSNALPTQTEIPMPVTADPDALDPFHHTEDGDQVAETTSRSGAVPTSLVAADAVIVDSLHNVEDADQAAEPTSGSDAQSTQPDFPMPVTADVDAIDPTDRPCASPPPSPSLDVQSTPGSVSSPVLAPRPAGPSIPVSISVHSATLRAMTQRNENLATTSSDVSTQVDGLFTPGEPMVTTTENELESRRILTELAQYVFGAGAGSSNGPPSSITEHPQDTTQSSASPSHASPSASLPEVPLPLRVDRAPEPNHDSEPAAHDVFGQVPATNNHVPEVATTSNGDNILPEATSLPYRAPSVSMRVTLTRKPTDPVLMADPYPYCLSTPGPSMYPLQDEASEEEIGLDNSQSSNSTIEKEIVDKDASSTIDDGESLEFQYPPVTKSVSRHGEAPAASQESGNGTVSLAQGQMAGFEIAATSKDNTALPSSSSTAPLITDGPTTKRKRGSSPGPSQRPNTPVKTQKARSRKTTKVERKGKSRAAKTIIPEQTSDETILVKPRQTSKLAEPTKRATSVASIQESQASSVASVAYKMLQPGSRSSSVSSAVPDNRSVVSQPSPTANKPNPLAPQPTVNLESLFHAHGQKKKVLALTIQHTFSPRAQPKKPQLSRFPSTSTIPDQPSPTSSTAALSPAVPPPKPDTPTAKTTTTPSRSNFSTPVTRSHCRYHRISLPKEEGGTRVNFLVPGCSLNDKELMDEEEIVDHGDATVDDSRNMLKDIENLDFSLDLIGIIRQLVGLDILREQEVFYLPQPGEVVTWKKASLQKSVSERAAMVRAPGEASSHAGSPGGYSVPGINAPPSNRPPASYSSYSSSPSVDSAFIRGSAPSFKPEQSDDEEPATKRSRPSPDEPNVMGPPSSQSKGKQSLKPRKSKKIDLTYEPKEEDQDEASDHTTPTSSRKRRKSTRGVKRSRTSEIMPTGNGGDERESKKLKSDSSTLPEPEPQSEPQPAPTAPEHSAT